MFKGNRISLNFQLFLLMEMALCSVVVLPQFNLKSIGNVGMILMIDYGR